MNLDRFQQVLASDPPSSTVREQPDTEGQLELGRVFAALKRRALLIVGITAAVTAAAGVRALLQPPTYQARFEILIQPLSAETEAIASIDGLPLTRQQRTLSLEDQVKILTSPTVLASAAEQLAQQYPEVCGAESGGLGTSAIGQVEIGACYKALVSRLGVELTETEPAQEGSRIFRTVYQGNTQEEAAAVAGLVAETFLDYGLENRQRDILQGLEFLEQKLPEVRNQVDSLQGQLQALRQRNNLISPEYRAQQLSNQVAGFRQEYLSTQIELKEANTLLSDLSNQQQPVDAAASQVLSESNRYQALVGQLLELDSQIAEASSLFLDSSPDIQTLQDQRQNLLDLLAREKLQVQRELQGRIKTLESREQSLASTLAALDADVDNLASLSRQVSDIELELSIATENLNRLLERREVLQLESAQRELPWELITPPIVSAQAESLPMNVALGLVLGLLLGVGVALTIDTLKDQLYTPGDLKRVTPLPILGLVPYSPVLAEPQQASPHAVAFNNGSVLTMDTTEMSVSTATPKDFSAFRESFRSLVGNLRPALSRWKIVTRE